MTAPSKPNARAQAARRNGAKSRGPKTAAGKAVVARSALKHGLTAQRAVLLDHEDEAAFDAFRTALRSELEPDGVLQSALVNRIALALWRTRRADQIEAALLTHQLDHARRTGTPGNGAAGADFALALTRDGNGPRSLDTLLRYRGSAHAELFRALGALKALQAEAAAGGGDAGPLLAPSPTTKQTQDLR